MKKNLCVIALVAACFTGMAQIGKGRMMIGGGFSYYQSSNEQKDPTSKSSNESKYSSFTPSLRVGRFFSEHWMFGLFGSYNNNTSENSDNSLSSPGTYYFNKTKSTDQSFTAGLFTRYYKMIGESKFAWYGQFSAGYGTGSAKVKQTSSNPSGYGNSDGHSTTTNLTAYVNPGIVYFLNKNIAVEASFGNVGYRINNAKNYNADNTVRSENKSSGFNSGLNFSLSSLSLGVNFYFGGKSQSEPAKG